MENKVDLLDHGFVRLVDSMGDDDRIVQAARVSTGKGLKTPKEDRNLIRYMMRNKHTTPFEKVRFEFHCKMPIFVARQWIRHRMGSFNEFSARYSQMPEEFYIPAAMRKQSTTNKQGSGSGFSDAVNQELINKIREHSEASHALYREFLSHCAANELARLVLPVNIYTEWYWTVDLHNLFHFLQLRLHEHAQYEIRVYAEAIYKMIKEIVPVSCEAFEDYRRNCITFHGPEIPNVLNAVQDNQAYTAELSKREVDEFSVKITRIFDEAYQD